MIAALLACVLTQVAADPPVDAPLPAASAPSSPDGETPREETAAPLPQPIPQDLPPVDAWGANTREPAPDLDMPQNNRNRKRIRAAGSSSALDTLSWLALTHLVAAPGLLAFLPGLLVCTAAGGLLGLVYPLSGGNPVLNAWCLPCAAGAMVGVYGWLLSVLAAVAGPLLTSAALGVAALHPTRPIQRRRVVHAVVVAAAVLATMPIAVALTGASGLLPWGALVLAGIVGPRIPSDGQWVYWRWLGINVAFMAAVITGVVAIAAAALLPTGSGALAVGVGSWLQRNSDP